MVRGDERAHLHVLALGEVGRPYVRDRARHFGGEAVVDPRSGDYARGGCAVLPGVGVGCIPNARNDCVQIRVVEDHYRRLTAELEVHALERVCRSPCDCLHGDDIAGQGDHVHPGMVHYAGSDRLTVPGYDVQDAARKDVGGSSAILRVVSGVCSEGFSTTILPAARAGPIFQTAIIRG
jgi:hypothetical protein